MRLVLSQPPIIPRTEVMNNDRIKFGYLFKEGLKYMDKQNDEYCINLCVNELPCAYGLCNNDIP